jgi:hypothetical protein
MGEAPARGVPAPDERPYTPVVTGRLPRQTLLPAVGFGVLLLTGLVVVASTATRPEAALYRATRAYVGAITASDVERARAFHVGPAVDVPRLADARGWFAQITAVRAAGDGTEGDVILDWFDRRGMGRGRERLRWIQVPGRGWRIGATAFGS